jgi:hypothetical protein
MHVDRVRVGTDDPGDLLSDRLQPLGVRAEDAELDRIGDRWTERRAEGAGANARELIGQLGAQPGQCAVASRDVLRQHDELGEVRPEQLLVERQVVARRAVADVADEGRDVRVAREDRLEAPRLRLGRAVRRPLGQPQLDQDLGAIRRREELLLGRLHAQHPEAEECERRGERRPAPAHAGLDRRPQSTVEPRVVDFAVALRHTLQHVVADERRRADRGDPGHQQRDGHDLEDREGVLPGGRTRGGDRQKTHRGDQRAGQHREGGAGVGVGRGPELVPALLDLACHHLDRDHRVVDQQAERDHQRAGRDPVQVDAEPAHREEGPGEHQRDRQRDDRARPQPERDERDRQHDRHRLEQRGDEQADRALDQPGLVGHLRELDAHRQVRLQARHRALEVAAELEHIAGRNHRDREADRLPAAEAHRPDRRIGIPPPDLRRVAQAHRAAVDRETQFLHLAHRVELPGHPQRHLPARALHDARRGDDVLRGELLGDPLRIDAEVGERLRRQLDPDLLVLRAHQLDLGDVRQPEQRLAHVLHRVAKLGEREAVGGERVDRPEDVAELVVEERSDRLGGQL